MKCRRKGEQEYGQAYHDTYGPDEALRHPDHRRPLTRRELISQGFRAGGATLLGTSLYSLLGQPGAGHIP